MIEYDYTGLVDEMLEKIEESPKTIVVAVLFYKNAMDVIKELLCRDGVVASAINIEPEEYDGYGKEYLITLTQEDFAVEKLWHDGNEYHKAGYLGYDADYIFIDADANSKAIKAIDAEIIELDFDYDGDDDEDCDECDYHCGCVKGLFRNIQFIEDADGFVENIVIPVEDLIDFLEED